jgi:hypothetical protein
MRRIRLAVVLGIIATVAAWPAHAQGTRVLDNPRVEVRSMTGSPFPGTPGAVAVTDDVAVAIEGSLVLITLRDNRAFTVQLKHASPGPAPASSPYPPAFPRPGATKLYENARVLIWDVQWLVGEPGPLHTHPYDNVNITIQGGRTRSIPLDGAPADSTTDAGNVAFNVRDRVHREQGLSRPGRRSIVVELK